jgi:hypothetical protein
LGGVSAPPLFQNIREQNQSGIKPPNIEQIIGVKMSNSITSAPFNWRDHLKVHPAADLFPLLSEQELKELAEDIRKNGLQQPITVSIESIYIDEATKPTSYDCLIDGRNRLDALASLGWLRFRTRSKTFDNFVQAGQFEISLSARPSNLPLFGIQWQPLERLYFDELEDVYSFVLSVNVHRRHLTAEQKRELIAKLLKADPSKSDRQIAELSKASPTTVGKVRAEKEASGDVSKLDTRTDSKGRKQPSSKPKAVPEPQTPAQITAAAIQRQADEVAAKLPSSWEMPVDEYKATVERGLRNLERGVKPCDPETWHLAEPKPVAHDDKVPPIQDASFHAIDKCLKKVQAAIKQAVSDIHIDDRNVLFDQLESAVALARAENASRHQSCGGGVMGSVVELKQRGKDKRFFTSDQKRAMGRVAQLTRIYREQYPDGLPHNALGVKYARYMCRTLAFFDSIEGRERWLDRYAPWINAELRAKLAGLSAYWYSARSLGQHLELYDEDRERLEAWTIEAVDITKEQREAINLEKRKKSWERYRRKQGINPREQSASRTKPWEAAGFNCRRTWERHGKPTAPTAVSQTSESLLFTKDISLTCDTGTAATKATPTLPSGWPYCAEHIVCRDGNQRRTLQDMSLGKSRVPIPATTYQEAA